MAEPNPTTVAQLLAAGRDREAAEQGALADGSRLAPSPTDLNGAPMDPLQQLEQLAPLLASVVGGIEADQLDAPTPCADLDVRGVLEHMIGGATLFTAAYRGAQPGEPDVSDPLATFGPALGGLGAAASAPGALDQTIASPFGEVSGEHFARYIVLDGLVHGWDMATSTGQAYDPPAELVAEVTAFADEHLDGLRGPGAFDAALEPPEDASPMERLAAQTGRRPLTVAT